MKAAAANGEKLRIASEGTIRLRLGDGKWSRARSRGIDWMKRTGYRVAELNHHLGEDGS